MKLTTFFIQALLFCNSLLFVSLSSFGNEPSSLSPELALKGYFDGPYILYKGNKVDVITVDKSNDEPEITMERIEQPIASSREFLVLPNNGMDSFKFNLFNFADDETEYTGNQKIFVVSDVEGNFQDFVSILKVSGVINNQYQWTYGSNRLVVNGDLFDRGTDVLPILWLCYKLDYESKRAGGFVHIILGNHDEMNLRGNTKYVDQRYLNVALKLGVEYKRLFDQNSELGRWLRTKNGVAIIDSILFVHGGISLDIIDAGISAEEINTTIRQNLGKDKATLDGIPKLIWGSFGPFWYRGLVLSDEKYLPIQGDRISDIQKHFGVKQIIVGHCVVSEVIGLHKGAVVAVDVDHPENKKAEKSRALIISNGKFETINDKGEVKPLPTINSFYK